MSKQLSVFTSDIHLFLPDVCVVVNYLELVAKLACYKTVINVSETRGKICCWQGEYESPDTNIPPR